MADQIIVKCQQCWRKLRMSSEHVGKKGRCPNCDAVIRVQREGTGATDGSEQQVVDVGEIEMPKDAMLNIRKQNDVAIVGFATSRILDQSNVQQLGDEFDALVDKYKLGKIVVNFNGVTYMSSAVMGKLVSLLKKVKTAKGKLTLCNIEDSIFEIFEIMRFDKMFQIRDTEDEAVAEMVG